MKTNTLKTGIIATILWFAAGLVSISFSQSLTTVAQISHINPTDIDEVKIFIEAFSTKEITLLDNNFSITYIDSLEHGDIDIFLCYYLGYLDGTGAATINSVNLGKLKAGSYNIVVKGLYNKFEMSGCITGDSIETHVFTIDVSKSGLTLLENENFSVRLHPNPARESITLSFSSALNNPNIEIYNLEGRLIKTIDEISSNENVTIDISTFSKGVYLLKLRDKDNVITKKFIKD